MISWLLESDLDLLSVLEEAGNSILHLAVESCAEANTEDYVEMINMLLNKGHSTGAQIMHGETTFHYAAKYNDGDAFQLLLNAAKEADILGMKINDGRTTFDYTLEFGSSFIVGLIIKYRGPCVIPSLPSELQDVDMVQSPNGSRCIREVKHDEYGNIILVQIEVMVTRLRTSKKDRDIE